MTNLKYSMITASKSGVENHPQKEMKKLGIEYKSSEVFPVADAWVFRDCSSVPKELPKFLSVVDD